MLSLIFSVIHCFRECGRTIVKEFGEETSQLNSNVKIEIFNNDMIPCIGIKTSLESPKACKIVWSRNLDAECYKKECNLEFTSSTYNVLAEIATTDNVVKILNDFPSANFLKSNLDIEEKSFMREKLSSKYNNFIVNTLIEILDKENVKKEQIKASRDLLIGEGLYLIRYEDLRGYFGALRTDFITFYIVGKSGYKSRKTFKTPILCCFISPYNSEYRVLTVERENI